MAREQILDFGTIKGRRLDDIDLLYFISGKRLYEIGSQSGEYPPLGWRRPGFLVGKPIGVVGAAERPEQAAHLLSEMGGVWAHPTKAIESFYFSITEDDETWVLKNSDTFVNHLAYVDFVFKRNGFEVTRTDFVVEDLPALFALVRIVNRREHAALFKLNFLTMVNILPSWFSGLPNGDDIVFYDNGRAIAYDSKRPEHWAVVFGTKARPESEQFGEQDGRKTVKFTYGINLGAGEEAFLPFLFIAENQRGYPEAIHRFNLLIGQGQQLLQDKIAYYEEKVFSGVRFDCSDPWHTMAFYTAKANLVMLTADVTPYVGRYLYAGIPEYVQFFGTDTAYSIPGLMVVDYWDIAKDALLGLASYGDKLCGRIPHEISTGGRVFHPGNTQETPQYTIAAWNYFKWTGDRVFLEDVYPICAMGVLDYVPAHWDVDLDYYPDGNGVVERTGMGSEKLDSICYFTRAIYCLADMAEALGSASDRERYLQLADDLKDAINADWWIEEDALYADSLNDDHSPRSDGHWTIAVPMETGMAPPDRAVRSLERIRREWVNRWGMVHTKDKEDFVWTLPTGVLAMAEFRYGDPDFAVRLLRNITETTETGTLGTYKELIPEGLSFMQLWSPAMYLQGLIEGVFGLRPEAKDNFLEVSPKIPSYWEHAEIENLRVGEHRVSIFCDRTQGEKTSVAYVSGRGRFKCRLKLPVEAQTRVLRKVKNKEMVKCRKETVAGRHYVVFDFEMEPAQRVEATYVRGKVTLEIKQEASDGNEGSGG
ncbi:MAG: hypothetical protein HYY30_11875 [Chloroflexi bacterium]|nr:hypothetical protein [Chloroflexota bacterium]